MSAKRQQFLKPLARGWTPAAARREFGICRSASRNWGNGHNVRSGEVFTSCVGKMMSSGGGAIGSTDVPGGGFEDRLQRAHGEFVAPRWRNLGL